MDWYGIVRPHDQDKFGLLRRAEPGEFRPVKAHFRAPGQLVEVHRRSKRAEGETIGLGHGINIVGGDHAARSSHVLHDDGGISRDVFAHMLGENSRP